MNGPSNQENNLTKDDAVQLYNKICSSNPEQLALLFDAKTIPKEMVDTLKSEARRQLNDYFAVREKTIQPGQSCNTSLHQEHPVIQAPDINLITDTDEEYNAFDRQPWITKLALGMPWIQTIFAGTSACAAATAIYNQADPKITQPLIGATALLTTSALIDHYDAYQARLRLRITSDDEYSDNDWASQMREKEESRNTGQPILKKPLPPIRYDQPEKAQPKEYHINQQITDMSNMCNPRKMNMKAIFRR